MSHGLDPPGLRPPHGLGAEPYPMQDLRNGLRRIRDQCRHTCAQIYDRVHVYTLMGLRDEDRAKALHDALEMGLAVHRGSGQGQRWVRLGGCQRLVSSRC